MTGCSSATAAIKCVRRLGEPDTRRVTLALERRREHREALPHRGNGLRQFGERIGRRRRGSGALGQLRDESRDHRVGDLALHLMTLHPRHGGPLEPRRRGEPLHQRALADAGVAEQQPVPRRTALGSLPRLVQLAILAPATDEGPATPLIGAHRRVCRVTRAAPTPAAEDEAPCPRAAGDGTAPSCRASAAFHSLKSRSAVSRSPAKARASMRARMASSLSESKRRRRSASVSICRKSPVRRQ